MPQEAFPKPIAAKSLEEHEKILKNKMVRVEFEYINKIISGKLAPADNLTSTKNIKSLLNDCTELGNYAYLLCKSIIGERKIIYTSFEDFVKNLINKVAKEYEDKKDNWINNSLNVIENEAKSFVETCPKRDVINDVENEKPWEMGDLCFNATNISQMDNYDKNNADLLRTQKLNDEDILLEMHLDAPYLKGKSYVSFEDSFRELALKIIKEHTSAKAIIIKSWVVDALKESIFEDFNIYNRDSTPSSNESFWGQFIDINGQIKEKEVAKFLETGLAKYSIASACMPVEEFLKRYLPEENHGEIILKDPNLEILREIKEEDDLVNDWLKNWDSLSEVELETKLSRLNFLKQFSQSESGHGFFEYILDLKKQGTKLEEIKNAQKGNKFQKPWRDFKEKMIYQKERKVII